MLAKQYLIAGRILAVFFAAGGLPGTFAQAQDKNAIPQFASKDFGWQTNVEDWSDPPRGSGHGPMRNDPDYPYRSNAIGSETGLGPTVRIANAKDPILKPWAVAKIARTNEELLKGERELSFTAQSRCWPGGVPGQLLYPFEPFYAIQKPDEVWLIWQRDHLVRRVRLNMPHSENPKPSWFGESVGHYENGDTLVVDTIGLKAHEFSYIDNFRTPHSEKLHVIERFTIAPDGQSITGIVTVEDPDTFNAPLSMKQVWHKVNFPMLETVCPENNGDLFSQNLHPMPEADRHGF